MNIEPNQALDELARKVIGAAIEVHRHLGAGYLEGMYEEALCWELAELKIGFEWQKEIGVAYKCRRDLLVGGGLVVELKAVEELAAIHRAQVISYLKAAGLQLGRLINFNVPVLKDGGQRVVYTGK